MSFTSWKYDPIRSFDVATAERRYERKIRLFADGLNSEEDAINYMASQGLRLGAALPENPNAFIQSIRGRVISDQEKAWEVDLIYGTSSADNDNPLLQPPEIDFGIVSYTEAVERDRDGEPILNSAGEPFDEPVEVEKNRIALRITRNESYQSFLSSGVILNYQDAINSDPFLFASPEQAKINVTGRYFVYNGSKYIAATYEIHFKREGWKSRPLDQGYNVKEDGFTRKSNSRFKRFTRLVPIKNADGSDPDKPQLLDGDGKLLPSGGTPVFLEKNVFTPMPFGALNLPVYG